RSSAPVRTVRPPRGVRVHARSTSVYPIMSDPNVESYHTQHSPLGAFASFTVGLVDSPGGFGHALRGPARQNVYVGFRAGDDQPWRLLPFFQPAASRDGTFTGEAATAQPPRDYARL